MPRQLRRQVRFRIVLYIIGSIVILALVAQALLIKELYARTEQLRTQELKTALVDSIKILNTELVVDPQTGRRSIPSARVVLPAKLDSHVYYRGGGEDSTLLLIDAGNQMQAIGNVRSALSLEATFKQVDILQQCSRQVVVSLNVTDPKDSSDKLTLKNTKKLKDGRTAYIYQNECPYGAEPLLRSINQMESF